MTAPEVRDPADADAWAHSDHARHVAGQLTTRQRQLLAAVVDQAINCDHTGAHWLGDHDERAGDISEDDLTAIDDLVEAGLVDNGTWQITELGDTVTLGLTTGKWSP